MNVVNTEMHVVDTEMSETRNEERTAKIPTDVLTVLPFIPPICTTHPHPPLQIYQIKLTNMNIDKVEQK